MIKKQLNDVGEYGLHKMIRNIVANDSITTGPGDDAAVLWITDGLGIVVCTDILPSGLEGSFAGKFAVIHNFSDLLAMGAQPIAFMLTLCTPKDTELDYFSTLILSAKNESEKYGANLVGGDTKEKNYESLTGIGIGILKNCQPLSRKGALPGDIVALTKSKKKGIGRRWAYHVAKATLRSDHSIINILKPYEINDLILPYHEMLTLANSGKISSAIDCSDGLSATLNILSEVNDIGFIIYTEYLDNLIAEETKILANQFNILPSLFAFNPGYDWECIVTLKASDYHNLKEEVNSKGGDLIQIGIATDKKEIILSHFNKTYDIPLVGDMKFSSKEQYNKPETWLKRFQELSICLLG